MTTQPNLTQAYDLAASRWRTKMETLGYAAAYRWLITQTLMQTAGARVLDVGCGTGDFSRALIEVAGPPQCLTLLDPSAQMLAVATRSLTHMTSDLCPLVAGLEKLRAGSHDIILCAHVIEHFANLVTALQHLKAQLAPSGRMLLVVSKPHWCSWIIWVRWRHRMIAPQQMLALLRSVGLTCTWNAGFPAGPPSRSSHAYLIAHQ